MFTWVQNINIQLYKAYLSRTQNRTHSVPKTLAMGTTETLQAYPNFLGWVRLRYTHLLNFQPFKTSLRAAVPIPSFIFISCPFWHSY